MQLRVCATTSSEAGWWGWEGITRLRLYFIVGLSDIYVMRDAAVVRKYSHLCKTCCAGMLAMLCPTRLRTSRTASGRLVMLTDKTYIYTAGQEGGMRHCR